MNRRSCASLGCTNAPREGRRFCCTCRSRQQDERHPERRAFRNLKAHAKARGKRFTLTFHDFIRATTGSGYVEQRGCTRDALQIDRIDSRRGYEPGNLQVLCCSDNARKAQFERGDADESDLGNVRIEFAEVA